MEEKTNSSGKGRRDLSEVTELNKLVETMVPTSPKLRKRKPRPKVIETMMELKPEPRAPCLPFYSECSFTFRLGLIHEFLYLKSV